MPDNSRIRLLVFLEVPHELPLKDLPIPSETFLQQIWNTVSTKDVRTRIQFILCRNRTNALIQILRGPSIVWLGGRIRHWWPTREGQLARLLVEGGHRVRFVDAG